MNTLVEMIQDAGYADRILTEKQLARILGSGDASRYGLVNRALKDGSLARIMRGLYTLSGKQSSSLHPFVVAQSLRPGSYVSFESALSYHGWIPEAVYTTTSVTPGRKSFERETSKFGHFSFHPIAIEKYGFLISVDRVRLGTSIAMVAQPLRALMDLVAFRKIEWQELAWIEHGLRIERSDLVSLRKSDFSSLHSVYKHRRARGFLDALENEVLALKSADPNRKNPRND
ncbi:MAG: hypothetical protein KDA56_06370 [Hyphomonas sp.]|jgi:hypothetical protein|nr:hypothetical protein [Hyphomonas sp.]